MKRQPRPVPGWVITDNYTDEELGILRSGKEAGCFLVRRSDGDRWCLLIRKDYRKRSDRAYNQPVAAGERRIRKDVFMESVNIRLPSARKAIRKHTAVGRQVLESAWASREYATLDRLWSAGASVPFPVERSEHSLHMQYVGTTAAAAPRLADMRLERVDAVQLFERIVIQLQIFAEEGVVHGDLSAYNILVQHGRPWLIDMPQSVDLGHSMGKELFARDVRNVCLHLRRYGVQSDPDALCAELLERAP
jgi:RIO kinase 1